jgi:hypothetical protein
VYPGIFAAGFARTCSRPTADHCTSQTCNASQCDNEHTACKNMLRHPPQIRDPPKSATPQSLEVYPRGTPGVPRRDPGGAPKYNPEYPGRIATGIPEIPPGYPRDTPGVPRGPRWYQPVPPDPQGSAGPDVPRCTPMYSRGTPPRARTARRDTPSAQQRAHCRVKALMPTEEGSIKRIGAPRLPESR